MNRIRIFIFGILPVMVIVLASYVAVKPLIIPGFYPMHDNTQVARVYEMTKALKDGFFPVRFIADLGYGYGYPLFNFYAPLAYYVGAFLMLIGASALIATKLMIGIGIVSSGLSMYLLAKPFWGKWGALLSAMFYLYAPYHALDIYVRGDVAEIFAYAFIPLAFYGFWQVYVTRKVFYVIVGALGFAGIILSHNLTALMVTPFLVIFALILILSSKNIFSSFILLSLSFISGIILSAFYSIPVFAEMKFTNVLSQLGGGADFHKNFVCLSQLWYSPWGYGGSIPGCIDGISFALGKIYIALVLLCLFFLPLLYKKSKQLFLVTIGSLVAMVVSLFMLLPYSENVWNTIHVFSFLQYPWRFLLLVFFFLSFALGSLLWLLQKYEKKSFVTFFVLVFLSILLIILQGKFFVPQYNFSATSEDFTSKNALSFTTSHVSDEYMPVGFDKPTSQSQVPKTLIAPFSGEAQVMSNKTQEKVVFIQSDKMQEIHIALAFFPSWKAYLNGKSTQIKQTKTGMQISIPKGESHLFLRFESTMSETIGNILSLASICFLILGIIYAYAKKDR